MRDIWKSPEYRAWDSARRRCTDQDDPRYPRYGGRGIKFKFQSIHEAVEYLGPRTDKSYCLDRIDNNGDYEPGNVRWTSKTISMINRRILKNNTSGHRGVCWDKNNLRWRAYVFVDKKPKFIGNFVCKEEAVKMREAMAVKYYGQEAQLR